MTMPFAFFFLLSFSWFILSRLLMPCARDSCPARQCNAHVVAYGTDTPTPRRYVIPKTYAKLGREPGAQGYWDASFASTVNSFVTAGLGIHAMMRTPSLMTSEVQRHRHAA